MIICPKPFKCWWDVYRYLHLFMFLQHRHHWGPWRQELVFRPLYSLRTRRLISIGIPIINLRRSSVRLLFIMGIPIPGRRGLLMNRGPAQGNRRFFFVITCLGREMPARSILVFTKYNKLIAPYTGDYQVSDSMPSSSRFWMGHARL